MKFYTEIDLQEYLTILEKKIGKEAPNKDVQHFILWLKEEIDRTRRRTEPRPFSLSAMLESVPLISSADPVAFSDESPGILPSGM